LFLAQVFFSAILPVFAVALVGYLAGKRQMFDTAMAVSINKFVFLIAVPALLFRLISGAPIHAFPWGAAMGYLAVETVIMVIGAWIARSLLRRERTESLLLGMTAGFSNHVFIILPITLALYGEEAARTVVAIIVIDAMLVFSAAILILDITTSNAATHSATRRLGSALLRNPPVIGMAVGLAVALIGVPVHEGVAFFTRFLGDAGPPASLFALGVVLASRTDKPEIFAPAVICGLKLVAMPVLIWFLFRQIAPIAEGEAGIALLTSTGPCGAMPFVLALQFGAPAATIARALLYSTFLSAFLIAVVVNFLPPV
jgi:hypothetical protein